MFSPGILSAILLVEAIALKLSYELVHILTHAVAVIVLIRQERYAIQMSSTIGFPSALVMPAVAECHMPSPGASCVVPCWEAPPWRCCGGREESMVYSHLPGKAPCLIGHGKQRHRGEEGFALK